MAKDNYKQLQKVLKQQQKAQIKHDKAKHKFAKEILKNNEKKEIE